MKKVLSLVLVIAMVLSSMSFAFAGTFEDVTGDYEDAVEALVALGVINGYEDGTFRPEKTITRAELAKVLVEALGYGQLVAGANSNFSDTQNHWANGYVAIAAGTGLVIGYPDGTFLPDKAVTYDEALTMVVRAVGYTDASLKGTWPTNYKVKAIDLDLTDDVVMAKAAADRGGVAQILYNALEVSLVEIDEDGVVVKTGKMLIDNIATPDTITVSVNTLDADHDDYAGDVVDLEPYMYENIDVYVNDDDEVVYVKDSNSTVYEGTVDDVYVKNSAVYVDVEEADGDIEDVKFADYDDVDQYIEEAIYENYKTKVDEDKSFDDLNDTETIKIVFNEDKDGDDVLSGIVVTEQTKAVLVENEYKTGRTYIDDFKLPVDDDGDVDLGKVTVKGAVDSVEDIAEDDVVVEYAAYDSDGDVVKTTLVVSRDTVEGKIKKVDGTKFYIDGVSYEENAIAAVTLVLGNDGIFYLDQNGDVVAFDGDTNEPTDYAIVIGVSNGNVEEDRYDNEAIDEYPQLKLVTAGGEEAYYDIYVDIDFDDVSGSTGDDLEDGDDYVTLGTGAEYDLVVKAAFANEDTLIKYSLNKDGMIDEMVVVEDLTDEDIFTNVDLDKSSNKLASNIVIFEIQDDGDYEVIDEDDLKTEFDAYQDRNSSGEIKILVVAAGQLAPSADTFAYIYDVSPALDDDDDDVAYLEVYYANGDTAFYSTDDYDATDFAAGTVLIVDFDGDMIDDDATATGVVATASAINYSTELIKINGVWYSMADDATVVREEFIGSKLDDTDLVDLGDIDEDTTEFTFFTTNDTDNEIGLIVFKVVK